MNDIHPLITEVLDKGFLMSLATIDDGGIWASEVIYVADDHLNLYWLSQPDARHSQALMNHAQVAATIGLYHGPGTEKIGLQIQGLAEKIDGDLLSIAKRYAKKCLKPEPMTEGETFKPGQSWYCLRPTKIDLIHQPLFGHEKKYLELT